MTLSLFATHQANKTYVTQNQTYLALLHDSYADLLMLLF